MLEDLLQGMRGLRKGENDPDWHYRECRELLRLRCQYRVEYRSGEQQHQGQIVDMGLGGMKLRCFTPPDSTELVEVIRQLPDATRSLPVTCKVQWIRQRERDGLYFVGLTYQATDQTLRRSWVRVLLRELGFRPDMIFQRRSFLRADCFVPVKVEQGEHEFEGKLCNLGVQGALVELPQNAEPGESVHLHIGPFEELPYFQVGGRVIQQTETQRSGTVSVRFEQVTDQAAQVLGRYLQQLLLHHWETDC